jgi:hypothetical protein
MRSEPFRVCWRHQGSNAGPNRRSSADDGSAPNLYKRRIRELGKTSRSEAEELFSEVDPIIETTTGHF